MNEMKILVLCIGIAAVALPVHGSADERQMTSPDKAKLIGVSERGEPFIDQLEIPALPDPEERTQKTENATTRGVEFTETFVDSQGRSLKYRYALLEGIDPFTPQPVLIHFHGNNSVTQDEILDGFFPRTKSLAEEYGLVPVVVASPETRPPPQEEVRHWFEEDRITIQEFFAERLPDHFEVDYSRIYFDGASQGTCFIHEFMQEFGESYGGGFHGGCGCYNSPDPTWTPNANFLEEMKVFVNSSTEDFLLETSYKGYAYYKYTIGVETRGDLEREGPHCSRNSSSLEMALDWFTGITAIPEEPFQPHWLRASAANDIRGLAVDDSGVVYVVEQRSSPNRAVLRNRETGSNAWETITELPGVAWDLESIGSSLFVILDGNIVKSEDSGVSFNVLEAPLYAERLNSFGDDFLFLMGNDATGLRVAWSADLGNSWSLFDSGFSGVQNRDSVAQLPNPKLVAINGDDLGVASVDSGIVNEVASPSLGLPFTSAWDGVNLWAAVEVPDTSNNYRLFRSQGLGGVWDEISLPEPAQDHRRFGTRITSLGAGKLLLSGWSESWMTVDNARSWQRVLGLETAWNGTLISRGDKVIFTDGEAAFELNAPLLIDYLFQDEFE